jgi:hypothetical protein
VLEADYKTLKKMTEDVKQIIEGVKQMTQDINNTHESLSERVTALDEPTNVDTTADDNVAGVAALGA